MPTARLSSKLIENLRPPAEGRADYWDCTISEDTSLPGSFGLRVSASGVKSWQIMFRAPQRDGTLQQKRMVLGNYPAFGLSEAREMGREALKKVARGIDPAVDRKVSRAKTAATPTVAEAVSEFIERYAKPRNKSWAETDRIFKRYVLPVWGDRLLPSIGRADVATLLEGIATDAPYMANRVLAAVRRFWNWCLEQGKAETSPAANIKAPSREVSRDRILSDQEIAAFWRACEQMGWPFGSLFQLLLVTGQREDEVGGMRWSDVDLERALWTLPREASKSDRLNQVPLPQLAIDVLGKLPRTGSELVFSTTGTTPVSGFSKAKARCDRLSDLTGWRLHDLRRTMASGMARLKVEPWIVEKVLNHQTGLLSGVAGVYNRWGYLDEKKEALERWARRITEIIDGR